MTEDKKLITTIGKAEPTRVVLRGHDLCEELIGHVSFGAVTYLMLSGRMPTTAETRMTEALLVALTEHGFTASAIAARMTYYSAPEALQGAVAAAILGAGSVHLGSADLAAKMLQEALAPAQRDGRSLEAVAEEVVLSYQSTKTPIPGIGHRLHATGDPRATRLFEVATETGVYGEACELIKLISTAAQRRLGRNLPVNVTGAIGAITSEMRFPWRMAKAFAIVGRTVGALAHLSEELQAPMANQMLSLVESRLEYKNPS